MADSLNRRPEWESLPYSHENSPTSIWEGSLLGTFTPPITVGLWVDSDQCALRHFMDVEDCLTFLLGRANLRPQFFKLFLRGVEYSAESLFDSTTHDFRYLKSPKRALYRALVDLVEMHNAFYEDDIEICSKNQE